QGEDRSPIQINQVAVGKVTRESRSTLQHLRAAIAQVKDLDVGSIEAGGAPVRRVENRFSARKNLRPAVGDFSGSEFGQGDRLTTGRGNRGEPAKSAKRSNDVSIFPPACAARSRSPTQHDGRPAVDGHLLKRAMRKEADPLSVGREKRFKYVLRARQ